MRILFNFLVSVLFIVIRAFFYLRMPGSQKIDVTEILADALVSFVLFKLLIWTIRKGKGWLLISIVSGLYFWAYLHEGFNLSENFSWLSSFIQMVAFVCISHFLDSAFKRSSRPMVLLIVVTLIIVGYGYNLFVSGNLIDSDEPFPTSGYSNNDSSSINGDYKIVDTGFEDLSHQDDRSNSECVRVQYRIQLDTDQGFKERCTSIS